MTIKKKNIPGRPDTASQEDDDFYAVEKKRIAEEAQKAHKIHELDVQTHLTAMIPHYEEAEWDDRRRLLVLNNCLINRFKEPGMMYWNIFRRAPHEIREYADLFGDDLTDTDCMMLITFLEEKKTESENMVEMGFDEDGEEDDIKVQKDDEEELELDSVEEEE